MANIFICPNCKKEFDENNPDCKAEYHYDDEDETGTLYKYDVDIECPFCKYSFWEEVWE